MRRTAERGSHKPFLPAGGFSSSSTAFLFMATLGQCLRDPGPVPLIRQQIMVYVTTLFPEVTFMHCQSEREKHWLFKMVPLAPSAEAIQDLMQISAAHAVVREYCRSGLPAAGDAIKHLRQFPASLGVGRMVDMKSLADVLNPPTDIEKLRRCFQ